MLNVLLLSATAAAQGVITVATSSDWVNYFRTNPLARLKIIADNFPVFEREKIREALAQVPPSQDASGAEILSPEEETTRAKKFWVDFFKSHPRLEMAFDRWPRAEAAQLKAWRDEALKVPPPPSGKPSAFSATGEAGLLHAATVIVKAQAVIAEAEKVIAAAKSAPPLTPFERAVAVNRRNRQPTGFGGWKP